MSKPFTREHDAEIISLYRQGWTSYQLADHFCISPSPILRILHDHNVELRKGKRRTWEGTPEQQATVITLYRDGVTVKDIKERTGAGIDRILQVVKDSGIPMRRRGVDIRALTERQVREAADMYQAGSTLKDIGVKFGVTGRTIGNYLGKHGITLREGGRPVFWTEDRQMEAVRRYQAGESQQKIADSWGVSQNGVSTALRKQGISTRKPQWRDGNPRWAGGRHVDGNGYIQAKPTAEDLELSPLLSTGYVLEHRLVMAKILGRPLLKTETVHHINGDRTDNRPENLQLRQGKHGKGIVLRCTDCGSHRIEPVPLT